MSYIFLQPVASGSSEASRFLVSHVAHGLGAAGTLVPLKPSGVVGEYGLADYSSIANVASFVGFIVDNDSYQLLSPGFHTITAHGLDLDAVYSGYPSSFINSVSITSTDFIQNAFVVVDANTIKVSLEEAQSPIPSCCELISQVAHGFSVGEAIYWSGATWELAVAEDPGVLIVKEVFSPDSFQAGTTACLTGVPGITKGVSYAVTPQSQVDAVTTTEGELVDVTTLADGDAFLPVGVSAADGCLIVSMSSGAIEIGSGGGGPVDPPATYVFNETFEGDTVTADDVETWGVENYENPSNSPFYCPSGQGVDSNFAMQETFPIGFTDGTAVRKEANLGSEYDQFEFKIEHGWGPGAENPTSNPIAKIHHSGAGGPTFYLNLIAGFEWQLYSDDGDGATGFVENTSLSPTRDKYYRHTITVNLGTAGGSDGTVDWVIEELQGSPSAGSDGTVAATTYTANLTGLNLRGAAKGIDQIMIGDYTAFGGALAAQQECFFDNVTFEDTTP